jgi:hypothetical protein
MYVCIFEIRNKKVETLETYEAYKICLIFRFFMNEVYKRVI